MESKVLIAGACVFLVAATGRMMLNAMKKTKFQGSSFYSKKGMVYQGPFDRAMTRREASLVLGVRENANMKAVSAAHRRLMMLNHPDNGGSTFLATKINEAKDIMNLK